MAATLGNEFHLKTIEICSSQMNSLSQVDQKSLDSLLTKKTFGELEFNFFEDKFDQIDWISKFK